MRPTRAFGTVVSVLLLVAMGVAPAAGGTADDPEVKNPDCSQPAAVDSDPALTPCSAWLEAEITHLADGTNEVEAIVVHATTLEDLEQRLPLARLAVYWHQGACRRGVQFGDYQPTGQKWEYFQRCDGDTMSTYTPLSADDISIAGHEMTVRLAFEGALSSLKPHFEIGDVLERPYAKSDIVLNGGNPAVEGVTVGPGRNFVIE